MSVTAILGSKRVLESGAIAFHQTHGPLALDLGGVRVEFDFVSSGSAAFTNTFSVAGNVVKAVLTNADNPLGVAFDMTGINIGGQPVTMFVMVHSIGNAGAQSRLLSYSIF